MTVPIIDLQRRLREIGRIRIGQQVPIANPKQGSRAKTRPVKLETFRLTSRDERVVDAAAALYGGHAQPWEEQPGQFEVITEAAEIPIMVPPGGLALTQWYELWSGGGCKRRCDGQTEYVGDQGCQCDPEKRDCSIHTRLSVVLSDLQGLGVWRLDTQGWYAATELGSVVPLLEGAAERGRFLPARLRLEQRQVLRDGRTNKFAVPVIDIDVTVGQMRSLVSGAQPVAALADPTTGEIAPPPPPGLTPVKELAEGPSVTQQVKTAAAPPSRARASTPQLPPTGVQPRSRADAEADEADAPTLGAGRASLPSPEEVALKRSQRIAIRLGELGFDNDGRHHLISAVTYGEKTSGKEVTDEEEAAVIGAAQQIKAGRLSLVEGAGGGWVLVTVEDATGDPPDNEADVDEAADETFDGVGDESGWTSEKWRSYLAARGVKMSALIRKAQELAPELGVTPPGNLDGIVGETALCALLRGFVEEQYEESSAS